MFCGCNELANVLYCFAVPGDDDVSVPGPGDCLDDDVGGGAVVHEDHHVVFAASHSFAACFEKES